MRRRIALVLLTLVVTRSGMRGHRFCPSALLLYSAGVLAPERPYGRKVSDSSVRATKSRLREKSWLALSLQTPSVLASSGRVDALPNIVGDGWIVRPIVTASNLPLQRCLSVRELDAVKTSRRCSFLDEAPFLFFLARENERKAIVSKLFLISNDDKYQFEFKVL